MACPVKVFCGRHVLVAEFPGAQLAQRVGKLAVGVVGSVLSRPPHVIPELTALSEPPEFLKKNLQADEAVDGDLMAAAPHTRCNENACLPPRLDRCPGDPQQARGHSHRHTRQLVPPVLQQNLSSLPDPLLIKPPRGHVMQQGNVSDNLLGAAILTSDGHPGHLLHTEQNYARFVQYKPVSVRVRSIMAIVADTEATVICAPSLPRHRHPATPRCDSDYVEPPHHAERPSRSRGTLAEPPYLHPPVTATVRFGVSVVMITLVALDDQGRRLDPGEPLQRAVVRDAPVEHGVILGVADGEAARRVAALGPLQEPAEELHP